MSILNSIEARYNNLSDIDREKLLVDLRAKYSNTELTKDVDIISDANLPFLMVVDALESLPKKGDSSRSELALTFLMAQGVDEIAKLGICYCEVKAGVKAPAISYINLGNYLQNKNTVPKDFWRGVYLIINAIFVKEERYVGAWFDSAEFFYGNFLSESYLVATIPGLDFNNKGVRHDMLCATNGTSDPDFLYTEHNIIYTAEFKLPTKTIEALAEYSRKTPKYIYFANILFTYNINDSRFYKIDYTLPDLATNKSYTIEALNIQGDSARIIKN